MQINGDSMFDTFDKSKVFAAALVAVAMIELAVLIWIW